MTDIELLRLVALHMPCHDHILNWDYVFTSCDTIEEATEHVLTWLA